MMLRSIAAWSVCAFHASASKVCQNSLQGDGRFQAQEVDVEMTSLGNSEKIRVQYF